MILVFQNDVVKQYSAFDDISQNKATEYIKELKTIHGDKVKLLDHYETLFIAKEDMEINGYSEAERFSDWFKDK